MPQQPIVSTVAPSENTVCSWCDTQADTKLFYPKQGNSFLDKPHTDYVCACHKKALFPELLNAE